MQNRKSLLKTILLIDDDPRCLKAFREALELEDYRVLTASDGRAGLKLAKEQRPDLILLDVNMPTLDGGDVARELDADPVLSRIPRRFLTSLVEQGENVSKPDAVYISKQTPLPRFLEIVAASLLRPDQTV